MFELPTPTPAKLSTCNVRTEKHGNEDVLAVDVGLALTMPSSALAMFGATVLDTFYLPPDRKQRPIEGVEVIRSVLRCPDLLAGPHKLSSRLEGRTVRIEYGELEPRDFVELENCKVNDFRVQPLEGGSVSITVRVQSSSVADQAVGHLAGQLQREVRLSLAYSEPAADPRAAAETQQQKPADDATALFAATADATP